MFDPLTLNPLPEGEGKAFRFPGILVSLHESTASGGRRDVDLAEEPSEPSRS